MMLSHSNYFFSINCKNVKKQQIGSFVMFKNKQSDGNSNAITGQIGANIRITGKIEAEDALGFGGEIEGDISAGELTVMHTAKINGQITANSAIISGTVIGDITADRLVILFITPPSKSKQARKLKASSIRKKRQPLRI